MDILKILKTIKKTKSPLKKQLLIASLITYMLESKGKELPVVIGGCALSYYSREVYFTADIDFAYADREAMDKVLKDIGFIKQGRYWVNDELEIAIEVPASVLITEDAKVEIVEIGKGLKCRIIGVEDLIIDRLNACKHWNSQTDCEMSELLIYRYFDELDWKYLENKAMLPENNTFNELLTIKNEVENEYKKKKV